MTSITTPAPEGKWLPPSINVIKGEVDTGLTFLAAAKAGLTGLDGIIMGGTEIRPVLLSALVESLLGLMVDAERYARSASQMLDALDNGGAK